MIKRKGSAEWKGAGKNGKGTVATPSGALNNTPYSFNTRFEGGTSGTNPEELLGAAHAGCFNMALSFILGEAGYTPDVLETTATLTMENINGGFEITSVHLDLKGSVPGLDDAKFMQFATKAKENCPVSKLFKGAQITMDAQLEKQLHS